MGRLRGWFFFTALFLFLLCAYLSLPRLGQALFGKTGQTVIQAAETVEDRVEQVWGRLSP